VICVHHRLIPIREPIVSALVKEFGSIPQVQPHSQRIDPNASLVRFLYFEEAPGGMAPNLGLDRKVKTGDW